MYVYMYVCVCMHITIALSCNRPSTAVSGDDTEAVTFEQWRTRLHTLLECTLSQSSSVRAPANSSSTSVPNRLAELFPKYLKLDRSSVISGDSYSRSNSTSSQGVNASSYSQAVFTVSIQIV